MVTTISLVGTRWRRCQGRGRLRPPPCACTFTLDSTSRSAIRCPLGGFACRTPALPKGGGRFSWAFALAPKLGAYNTRRNGGKNRA
jgi:hypothetical protein